MEKSDRNFHISFFILIFFSIFLHPQSHLLWFDLPEASFRKFVFYIYIYICLFYLPYSSFKDLDKYYHKKIKIIFYIILIYGFFQILRDIDKVSLYISIFGNSYLGPIFFAPLFFLWGTKINAIYWFNKISFFSITIGLILTPICLIFGLALPTGAFIPAYFLIFGFEYFSIRNKILLILAYIVSAFCFYISIRDLPIERVYANDTYRSGLVVLAASLIIVAIVKFKKKLLNLIFVAIMIVIPLFILVNQSTNQISVFKKLADLFPSGSIWSVDTRTFIYKEVIDELNYSDSMLIGKGPTGTYYSDYFQKIVKLGMRADHYFRWTAEVGLLHYAVKAGVIYIFLIFVFTTYIILNVLKNSKNNYLTSFSLFLSFYLMFFCIENTPIFNTRYVSFWIILGICASNIFIKLDDSEIKKLIDEKNKD